MQTIGRRGVRIQSPAWLWAACLLASLAGVGDCVASPGDPRPAQPGAQKSAGGRIEIVAALVASDLSVRPLPKFRFLIRTEGAAEGTTRAGEVVTGFDGRGGLDLPPGKYRLISESPISWEGSALSWDLLLEITAGATAHVEVSNDNARKAAAPPPAGQVSEEARIFQRSRQAVFLVETSSGLGSGFLADPAGLILTNFHVVGDSRYVAVKVDATRKYPAQVLSTDKEHDLAVIRINPEVLTGVQPLALAAGPSGGGTLVEGEKVLAIGNPIGQEGVLTTGIVSKVENDRIISDVNINPGNSGGPLLNLSGQVVGVNTFGLNAGQGPGISGIMRIHLSEKPLAEARAKAQELPPPASTLLPVASEHRYPLAVLKENVNPDQDTDLYYRKLDQMSVFLRTPPLLYFLEKRGEIKAAAQQKKRRKGEPGAASTPAEESQELQKYDWITEPVVIIQAYPQVKLTGGGTAAMIFGLGVGKRRFKTDFREMKLMRGGAEVTPILPGRTCETVDMPGLKDVGCYGQYKYRPEEFAPGAKLQLLVYSEDQPEEGLPVPLEQETLDQIWKDFQPYFAFVEKQKAAAPAPSPAPATP